MALRDVPHLTNRDRIALRKEIEQNRKERMAFIDFYTEWLKKTPNKVWSKQQAKYFGGK